MRGDDMQGFFNQQPDWLKTWQESQETLTKQFAGLSEEWVKNFTGGKNNDPEFFEGWFKSQGNLEDQFKEFAKRMNEMISNVWSNKVPGDLMKFMNVSFFEEFYKNWLSNIELPGGIKNPLNMGGGWQQTANFLRSFIEKENPFFSTFNSSKISEQMSRVFGLFQGGGFGQQGNPFGALMGGYQDVFGKLFESSTAQGAEKLSEVFDTWVKEAAKQLSAPKLGINRQQAQEISQALLLSQSYMQAYIKMAKLLEGTTRKAGIRFQSKLSEAALQNKPVTKFTDFCALWSTENEAVFLEIMGTSDFAKVQGDFIDAGHRLKIQWNKLAEKALDPTPIALKRDLNLAIAEIHQLKRDLKALRREFRDNAAESKKAQTASDTSALEDVKKAKSAEAAALEQAKKAKTAEAVAVEEAKKAKSAEAAAQAELKKAKTAAVAAEVVVKPVKTDTKAIKASPLTTTKSKSKNV
jgi:hypothetical protein